MKIILLALLIFACKPNSREAVGVTVAHKSTAQEQGDLIVEKSDSGTGGVEVQEVGHQPSVGDDESISAQVEPAEISQEDAIPAAISLEVIEDEVLDPMDNLDTSLDTNTIELNEDQANVNSTPAETALEDTEKSEVLVVDQTSNLHTAFDEILTEYVDAAGNVDYKGLKSNLPKLDKYLKALSESPVKSDWSKDAQLAYWINAYNAFTLKLIVDNYPLKSIMDLEGGKVWDKKWINLADKVYSLNEIEHDIIRPQFNEPRIHFAVNCAAASCPPLAAQAYTADNLESLLAERTKSFINNRQYNQISTSGAEVSKIFDWYGSDFGDLVSYLNKYSNTSIKKNASVSFKEYDWSLNSQ